jgi:HAD-superfamily hydrolase (TIGR02245 family)
MPPQDFHVLARILKNTVQRISCHLQLFNSNATFILICEAIHKIYIWVGQESCREDTLLAESVAFNILRDDYMNKGEIVTVKEGKEAANQQNLDDMLDQLFMKSHDYFHQAPLRSKPIENSPITLRMIRRNHNENNENEFSLKPISYSPLGRRGNVLPLPFLATVDQKAIAVLTTGNLCDIWFGEAVLDREKLAVKAYIIEMAMYKVPLKQRGLEAILFERGLYISGQERPTALFRENFTVNTRYLVSSKGKRQGSERKSTQRTSSNQQRCGDCVADVILRLLRINVQKSPSPPHSANNSFKSSDDSDVNSEDRNVQREKPLSDMRSFSFYTDEESPLPLVTSFTSPGDCVLGETADHPPPLPHMSPPRPGTDSIFMKLQRLANRTEIKFINKPRRNTKLLVLDLDHTLMDFSCRFDYMAEQLKRPYLDSFLAQVYPYYDIAVWSQTNFKWLELKLSELNMLNRADYKICFALDKSTMFTVRQQYVKPLEVIWSKCESLGWGPHNTVHVDDLGRNFELNKQSGILISPFHLKPYVSTTPPVNLSVENISANGLPLYRVDSKSGEIDSHCNDGCNTSLIYNDNGHNSHINNGNNNNNYNRNNGHNGLVNDRNNNNNTIRNDIHTNNDDYNINYDIDEANYDGNTNSNDYDTNADKNNTNDDDTNCSKSEITNDNLTTNGNHTKSHTNSSTSGDCETNSDRDHILDHTNGTNDDNVVCNNVNDDNRINGHKHHNGNHGHSQEDISKYDNSAILKDNNGNDSNNGRISGYLNGCSVQEVSDVVIKEATEAMEVAQDLNQNENFEDIELQLLAR